jgi:hypothetical protein
VLLLALLLVLLLSWAWHLRSGQHSTAQRTLAGPWHTVPLDVIHAQHMRRIARRYQNARCIAKRHAMRAASTHSVQVLLEQSYILALFAVLACAADQ